MRNALSLAVLFSASLLAGCGGGGNNTDRVGVERPSGAPEPTRVIFDPIGSQLPVPTDLQFSAEEQADGTMFVSDDTSNPVFVGIDVLDGNSVVSPFDITLGGRIDESSLDASSFVALGDNVIPNPDQNVFLLPLVYPGGDSLVTVDGEVPSFSEVLTFLSLDPVALAGLVEPTARAEVVSLDGGIDNVLRITPLKPLLPETKYLVVLTDSILDDDGQAIAASTQYDLIRQSDTLDALSGLRGAILGWERLAAGYFGFKSGVFSSDALAPLGLTAPTAENIVLSLTFTTAGTDSVVTSAAAPEAFFEKSLRIGFQQEAITNLVSGTFALSGAPDSLSTTDAAINTTLIALLTAPELPGVGANPLFDAEIAGAITAGADYATIAGGSAAAAFVMQTAAAQAAIAVHDSGAEAGGDATPFVDIATQAFGTVQALASGAGVTPNQLFATIPAARDNSFYRVDQANEVFALLPETAKVYQGQISLPSFQEVPTAESPAAIVQSNWQADTTIGAVIDAGSGNDSGTTPPSSAITYRYPFPALQSNVTVPMLAVTPDEALGATKPADGWPVVIFVHGIRQDRSNALPMGTQLSSLCLIPGSPLPCYATIAIDQTLHGIAPSGSTFPGVTGAGLFSVTDPDASIVANIDGFEPAADLTERHFDLTDDPAAPTGVPQAMDYEADFGGSGSLYINLANFANVRDNLRQMNLDLMNLVASIDSMDVDGDGVGDFDSNSVYLIGHSLGGISGTPFVATNNSESVQGSLLSSQPMVKAAAILKSGGSVPRLLLNSQSFGAAILGGLDAASGGVLTLGSSSLETYLSVFQGVLASADPINFAANLSDENGSTGILLTEVIGDGAANLPDLVIPNAADADVFGEQNAPLNGSGAPLAGTEPLISLFGADPSSAADGSDGDAAVLVTRFTDGNHGTPVSASDLREPEPADLADPANQEVFAELITEIATFFTFDGNVDGSIVANPDVVE